MMSRPDFHVFTRSDLADLEISPAEVISAVRESYLALANGGSRCSTKMMMPVLTIVIDAVSYAMATRAIAEGRGRRVQLWS
jgi:ornithine cyclodeaminase